MSVKNEDCGETPAPDTPASGITMEEIPPDGGSPAEFIVLDADEVLSTVSSLRQRITERFPESGLLSVCQELERVCARSKKRIEWVSQPIWPLRTLRYLLLALIVSGIVLTVVGIRPTVEEESLTLIDLIQTLEAALNDVILIGIGIFFVWNLESRLKSRRALRALHELRSIAHVIDMHQLTKDPDRVKASRMDTRSSPQVTMSAFLLRRYLDYCSEMLSLVGKVAALHLRKLDDATVVAAVNEIETLTTGLSEKIWQKIDVISREEAE